jgi:pimeloyl-ACP methyl ester carboxylesterase
VLLSATAETWNTFSRRLPPVGHHSFTAAARDPDRLKVEGDSLHVAQALHALERFFEILRGQTEDTAAPWPDAGMEKITGRYAAIRSGAHSLPPLYYERSGNPDGPPLLMLHTAGADSRQYHPLMANPALQQAWDMYAFDMPAHGRSMPAEQGLWQGYRLDKQTYAAICLNFIETVIKRPAVVLGCSMGAAMSLYVGRQYPDRVSAMVALEAPYRAKGRRTPYLAHPQANQAAHNPSYVRGLMSPASPLCQRRTAAWIYSQGGFQVYPGDLVFYSEEFDAEVDLQGLDGTSKPIHLLTGAYDYSATPADSKRVSDLIPGSRFMEMPELGHFPMIENPDALMVHLMPVLEEIREKVRK